MNIVYNFLFVVVYGLVLWSGNYVCKKILNSTNIVIPQDPKTKAGWLIGILERILVGIGILLKSWEIVAGVAALKSISRYRELDDKLTAEYFLIGSMVSLLWAFIVTFGFIGLSGVMQTYEWGSPNVFIFVQGLAASK